MSGRTAKATSSPGEATDLTLPLHRPFLDEREEAAVVRVMRTGQLAGNGPEGQALEQALRTLLGAEHVVAVSSATHALEIATHLADVRGGEVIVPSFTFPSVANAVVRSGGTIRFCEVRESDLNVDLDHALSLVTSSTRALVVTHYAGHPLDCRDVTIPVIEDAAHALGSSLAGRACGTLGAFGCFSFHQTKNVVAGEGGALIVDDASAAHGARIFREKGTNRDDFMAGRVASYSWVGLGSSLVMPEISAAIARVQLDKLSEILSTRRRIAELYDSGLAALERGGALRVVRPVLNSGTSSHHIYAVLVAPDRRADVMRQMAQAGVQASSHFVPLHSSPYGRHVTRSPDLPTTDRVAASVIRLPIYPGLTESDVGRVVDALATALTL